MKPALALSLLVSLVVLSGCAHHYLMKLSNGDQTISVSKPKLQGTNYLFTGRDGVGHVIPRSRVVKIKTISAEETGGTAGLLTEAEQAQALVFFVAGLNSIVSEGGEALSPSGTAGKDCQLCTDSCLLLLGIG